MVVRHAGPLYEMPVSQPLSCGHTPRTCSSTVFDCGRNPENWVNFQVADFTGQFTRIPVDYKADYHALNWTPDGKVLGLCLGMRPKIWKFQPAAGGR